MRKHTNDRSKTSDEKALRIKKLSPEPKKDQPKKPVPPVPVQNRQKIPGDVGRTIVASPTTGPKADSHVDEVYRQKLTAAVAAQARPRPKLPVSQPAARPHYRKAPPGRTWRANRVDLPPLLDLVGPTAAPKPPERLRKDERQVLLAHKKFRKEKEESRRAERMPLPPQGKLNSPRPVVAAETTAPVGRPAPVVASAPASLPQRPQFAQETARARIARARIAGEQARRSTRLPMVARDEELARGSLIGPGDTLPQLSRQRPSAQVPQPTTTNATNRTSPSPTPPTQQAPAPTPTPSTQQQQTRRQLPGTPTVLQQSQPGTAASGGSQAASRQQSRLAATSSGQTLNRSRAATRQALPPQQAPTARGGDRDVLMQILAALQGQGNNQGKARTPRPRKCCPSRRSPVLAAVRQMGAALAGVSTAAGASARGGAC
jgi:hypothetical protein